jgi:hypothetical protein
MDDRTLEALKASIAKWERNARAETPAEYLTATHHCPLCDLFYWKSDCHGCPVSMRTAERNCWGTPYIEASKAKYEWWEGTGTAEQAHAAARAEVSFLKSLLPPDEEPA